MDRLLDEEAAQEEADMKVTVMKGRLETLRKERQSTRLKEIT
jgi:zinc finger protein 830